jgi:hypothetical protein
MLTRGRHGNHASVVVLRNAQKRFYNRPLDDFDFTLRLVRRPKNLRRRIANMHEPKSRR